MQHLAWPFFADSHRTLAPEIRSWAERTLHGHDDESRDAEWLRGALDAVLAGERPPQAKTDPVGCTIKWR